MYTINIEYTTGDSFGSRMENSGIDLSWTNLEIAKANLIRIKEHNEYYKKTNNYYAKPDLEKLQKEAETKDWFTNSQAESRSEAVFQNEYSVMLQLDDGTFHKYYTFWIGYFEHLESAEVVIEKTEDDGKSTVSL